MKVLSSDWRNVPSDEQIIICRLKNYLQIEELLQIKEVFKMQIEELSTDHWRAIFRSKRYLICKSKNYVQIEELSANQMIIDKLSIICWWKMFSIYRSNNYLQIKKLSADQRNICWLKKYSIYRQIIIC